MTIFAHCEEILYLDTTKLTAELLLHLDNQPLSRNKERLLKNNQALLKIKRSLLNDTRPLLGLYSASVEYDNGDASFSLRWFSIVFTSTASNCLLSWNCGLSRADTEEVIDTER